ncbi:hypothetical protein [Phascolarctobacterium sp.]|uniref:hypothetical protein n=1 Tax=Phascolarctobacterium sp. TaxID=2049039 RepID=UPI0030DB3D6F
MSTVTFGERTSLRQLGFKNNCQMVLMLRARTVWYNKDIRMMRRRLSYESDPDNFTGGTSALQRLW